MTETIPDSAKSGNPDDRVLLHGMPSVNSLASSISPYVAKVEAFLRFISLEYDVDSNFKGPKGKVPWITHGDVVLGDSTFIIEYLKNTYRGRVKMKEPQTPQEKAINVSCLHICEDNLVYAMPYYRLLKPEGFVGMKKVLQTFLPFPINWIGPSMFRARTKKGLHDQGLGRHSENDIKYIMKSSLSALSTFLGDQKYFFGNEPCETDAIVFGLLDGFLYDDIDSPLSDWVREFPNLLAFVDNIRAVYFPPNNPSKFKR